MNADVCTIAYLLYMHCIQVYVRDYTYVTAFVCIKRLRSCDVCTYRGAFYIDLIKFTI